MFDAEYQIGGPDALAELDDAVFDLGALGAGSSDVRRLVLSFELALELGGNDVYAVDFALLAASPVPEPTLAALLACAAAALLLAYTRKCGITSRAISSRCSSLHSGGRPGGTVQP